MKASTLEAGGPLSSLGANTIPLLISDVDGTLVAPDKTLTVGASSAVRRLAAADIGFTLVSSRPPRGIVPLITALDVRLPFAAFNGGTLVCPNMSFIETHRLSEHAAHATLGVMAERNVDAWVFADGDWRLRNPHGPHVADQRFTVGFAPVIVQDFDDVIGRIDKIVGVSDNPERLAEAETEVRRLLDAQATIDLSQPFYLDVTAVEANKGRAVESLCAVLGIDQRRTAVIGDMTNDVAMFKVAGVAIAMGQSPDSVKAAASVVTRTNDEDGFADAIERFILPQAAGQRATR